MESDLRLPPPPPARETIVFKAVQIDDSGTIRSLYDKEFVYKLGKWHSQKARSDHRGGLYAYASLEEAQKFARAWAQSHEVGRLAILECIARGKPIVYENGKMAFSQLKPLSVVEVCIGCEE